MAPELEFDVDNQPEWHVEHVTTALETLVVADRIEKLPFPENRGLTALYLQHEPVADEMDQNKVRLLGIPVQNPVP